MKRFLKGITAVLVALAVLSAYLFPITAQSCMITDEPCYCVDRCNLSCAKNPLQTFQFLFARVITLGNPSWNWITATDWHPTYYTAIAVYSVFLAFVLAGFFWARREKLPTVKSGLLPIGLWILWLVLFIGISPLLIWGFPFLLIWMALNGVIFWCTRRRLIWWKAALFPSVLMAGYASVLFTNIGRYCFTA